LGLFTSMQENVYVQQAQESIVAHIDCNLVTVVEMPISMENAFSSILNRGVEITQNQSEVRAQISGPDLSIRTNNTKSILRNEDTFILVWDVQEQFYEAVFGAENRSLESFRPIGSYFDSNISSPVKTQEEVQAWRDSQ